MVGSDRSSRSVRRQVAIETGRIFWCSDLDPTIAKAVRWASGRDRYPSTVDDYLLTERSRELEDDPDREYVTDGGIRGRSSEPETDIRPPAHDIHDLDGIQRDILVVIARLDAHPCGADICRRLDADADERTIGPSRVHRQLQALQRAGLITRDWTYCSGHESIWKLTDDGIRLLSDLVDWLGPLADLDHGDR